jgi:cell wall-associated NlpC family hydrolase
MRLAGGCGTVSIGGGLAARRGEVIGAWKAALGASAVLAAGAGPLAAPAAAATAAPVERASATAVSILTPAGREASGTSPVFAWEAPVATRDYRFPDDGSLLRIGRVTASAERGSGDAILATGSVVLRSVELFGGMLRVDVVRTRASLRATDGAVADESVSHLVHVRLDGDPIELAAGKKLWVKGWGYAVVDDPVARGDSTSAGETLAGLRLHLTSAHSGLPAGTDIVLGGVHADLEHIPTAPAPDPGGSGGGGTTGTLPDRQVNPPRKHRRGIRQPPTAPRHGGRQGKPGNRHHGHAPRPPAPVIHPVTPPLHAAHGTGARAAIVRAALAQVGWPYVWGGESRTEGGFDCSGLVDHAYAAAGYQLPGRPTADVLWAMSVPLDPADLRPGDLVFLGARSRLVHHVGLYAGGGWVIAAPHHGALVSVEPLAAVPWDGFGRILRAPRGRILSVRVIRGSDRRPVSRSGPQAQVTANAVRTPDVEPTAAAAPAVHRSAPPPAPPRRRHHVDRLAVLPREDYRNWAVSLLASFRGAGR